MCCSLESAADSRLGTLLVKNIHTLVTMDMSVGESKGGLPPDSLVEDAGSILKDSQRLIERYHDNSRHAMTRMTIACARHVG
jgi:hypothetical protein